MATYTELITKIDDAFQTGKKLKITAREIEYLTTDEINSLQQRINNHNFQCINQAAKKGMIDDDAAAYLRNIYSNAEQITQDLVQKISYSLMSEYRQEKVKKLEEMGEEIVPEQINAIDTSTGEIEQNSPSGNYGDMPKYKEYQMRHVTPFTSMRLTYYDYRDNPVYEILPGLKDVRRAIDKIKQPVLNAQGKCISQGGKYYNQYQKDQQKIRKKYEQKILAQYAKDSPSYEQAVVAAEPQIEKEIAALPKPHQRLKDIVRLTITRKYYQDTVETLNLFRNDPQYGVQDCETKDSFHGNTNKSSEYETKNYRDKKVYLNMNGIKIELQIKITKLHGGDVITSKIYAGEEDKESRNDNILLISHQNTADKGMRFWEENKARYLTDGDRKLVDMKILEKQFAAQKVNKQNIREYNLQVLDKAFRLEDAKRANGKDFDAISRHPISQKGQKIYKIIAKFIEDNFMYRPFKAFDMQKKFNVSDSELKSLGLVTTKEQLEDIFNRYAEFILPKYNGRIEGDELPYFSLPENQATVSAVFAKHAYNEQPRPEILPDAEEQEMLQELEEAPLSLNAQKYNKILAKKERYYHNKEQQSRCLISRMSGMREM